MKGKLEIGAAVLGLSLLGSGCSDENARVAEVATQAANRQAKQNEEMSKVNREVAEAHKQLIAEEASARRDAMVVQGKLVDQQKDLNHQAEAIDHERRELASERYWEPIWGAVISNLAILAACALPLVVCVLLLRRSPVPTANDAVSDILLEELAGEPLRIGTVSQPLINVADTDQQPALPPG